jgi:hypothetical protein
MREFSSPISDLTKGISPLPLQARNTSFLYDAYNLRIGKFGIEPAPVITTLLDMPSVVWPLPQIIGTSTKNYVVSATTLYEMEAVTNRLIDVVTGLSGTRQYDVADFGLYQVWTNGTCLLEANNVGTFSNYTIPAMSFVPYTVCNFKGQLIMGGLGTAKKDWVSWGGIGDVDLDNMISVRYGLDASDLKNTAGYRKMPFHGQVYKVFPLETAVMVYSEGGVAALIPSKSPAPTYGMKEISNIRCTGAVGGRYDRHIFIDEDGYMWTIDEKLKLSRLGYNKVFENKDAVISYDDHTENFFICTPDDTYILPLFDSTDGHASSVHGGLSRLDRVVTSVLNIDKVNIAPYTLKANSYAEVVTDIVDFATRGIKTITAIEMGTDSEDMYVAIDYRFRGTDAFRTSSYKQVYRNGMVFPIVSGEIGRASCRERV